MNTIRKSIAAIAATGAVACIVTGAIGAGTATAAAATAKCTSHQFTTKLVAGEPGAGQRYATIRFTAKPGQTCTLPGHLPVTLTGAHNVLIDDQVPSTAPGVTIGKGKQAEILLHWSAIEAPADQQTPLAVSVNGHTLQWNQGSVDASPEAHDIQVGPVTKLS